MCFKPWTPILLWLTKHHTNNSWNHFTQCKTNQPSYLKFWIACWNDCWVRISGVIISGQYSFRINEHWSLGFSRISSTQWSHRRMFWFTARWSRVVGYCLVSARCGSFLFGTDHVVTGLWDAINGGSGAADILSQCWSYKYTWCMQQRGSWLMRAVKSFGGSTISGMICIGSMQTSVSCAQRYVPTQSPPPEPPDWTYCIMSDPPPPPEICTAWGFIPHQFIFHVMSLVLWEFMCVVVFSYWNLLSFRDHHNH